MAEATRPRPTAVTWLLETLVALIAKASGQQDIWINSPSGNLVWAFAYLICAGVTTAANRGRPIREVAHMGARCSAGECICSSVPIPANAQRFPHALASHKP